MICTLLQVLVGYQIKENEMDSAYCDMGRKIVDGQFFF